MLSSSSTASRQSVGVLQTRRHGAVDVVLSGREGDQSSTPTTSTGCRRSLVTYDCVSRHLALVDESDVTGNADWLWLGLERVKRYLLNQMVLAYLWPTDDYCDTTIQHLRMNVVDCFVVLCHLVKES